MTQPIYWVLDGREAIPAPGDDPMSWARSGVLGTRVALTEFPSQNGASISTVFLGTNYQLDPEGPPHIFETMVFASDYPEMDQECERYSTWDQAEAGHAAMVERFHTHTKEHANE